MGIVDIWKSERGFLALAIVVAATVLTAMGTMTVTVWQETILGVYGFYAVSKGATGVAAIIKGGTAEPVETSAPTPTSTPTPTEPDKV